MSSALIHPRFLAAVGNQFAPNRVTIQDNTPTRSPSGQQTDDWGDVAGLTNLRCRIAPASVDEVRAAMETYGVFTHTILIWSYQPTITIEQRATDDDDNDYDIVSVLSNPEQTLTTLQTRLVVT
jgi:head-tail adaptor